MPPVQHPSGSEAASLCPWQTVPLTQPEASPGACIAGPRTSRPGDGLNKPPQRRVPDGRRAETPLRPASPSARRSLGSSVGHQLWLCSMRSPDRADVPQGPAPACPALPWPRAPARPSAGASWCRLPAVFSQGRSHPSLRLAHPRSGLTGRGGCSRLPVALSTRPPLTQHHG